ncbi:MAG TPA: rod shape-determining protein RodA [Candidatus Dormibacteraeota bacterium]|nr:rod shape-determining protein RodA [Candidatus Dormibacteraeota bacterium]
MAVTERATNIREYDFVLGLLMLMVLVLGATAIFSASGAGRVEFIHQVVYIAVGLGVLVYFSLTDYRVLGRLYGLTYVAMILLLLVVRVAGHQALGAQRWIYLGYFELQASEISKLLVIIVLARFFYVRRDRIKSPVTFLLALALVLLPVFLILVQPDLGTAIVFIAVFYGMAIMAQIPKRYVIGSLLVAGALLPLIASRLQGYQRNRLVTFLNPGSDPQGAGYNILQAKIAVGSGGLFGKGFLTGTQGQLGFVPSRVTDFVFAIFSEEWGFVGALILLTLFFILLTRLLRASHLARDSFGALLCFGVATMIAFQVVVNVGMNLGVMPVVGIPLPFISYGGSSMLTNLAAIGIVQSVLIHHKDLLF